MNHHFLLLEGAGHEVHAKVFQRQELIVSCYLPFPEIRAAWVFFLASQVSRSKKSFGSVKQTKWHKSISFSWWIDHTCPISTGTKHPKKNSSSLFVGDITHMIPKMSENSSSLHLINRVTARSLHRLDLEVHGRHCASFFSSEVTTWIFVELSLLKGCIRENQANKKKRMVSIPGPWH